MARSFFDMYLLLKIKFPFFEIAIGPERVYGLILVIDSPDFQFFWRRPALMPSWHQICLIYIYRMVILTFRKFSRSSGDQLSYLFSGFPPSGVPAEAGLRGNPSPIHGLFEKPPLFWKRRNHACQKTEGSMDLFLRQLGGRDIVLVPKLLWRSGR